MARVRRRRRSRRRRQRCGDGSIRSWRPPESSASRPRPWRGAALANATHSGRNTEGRPKTDRPKTDHGHIVHSSTIASSRFNVTETGSSKRPWLRMGCSYSIAASARPSRTRPRLVRCLQPSQPASTHAEIEAGVAAACVSARAFPDLRDGGGGRTRHGHAVTAALHVAERALRTFHRGYERRCRGRRQHDKRDEGGEGGDRAGDRGHGPSSVAHSNLPTLARCRSTASRCPLGARQPPRSLSRMLPPLAQNTSTTPISEPPATTPAATGKVNSSASFGFSLSSRSAMRAPKKNKSP